MEIKFKTAIRQEEERINVFLTIDKRDFVIGNLAGMGIDVLEKGEYSDYFIPPDAVEALYSHWACYQTVYYVTNKEGIVSVKKGNSSSNESDSEGTPLSYTEIFSHQIEE